MTVVGAEIGTGQGAERPQTAGSLTWQRLEALCDRGTMRSWAPAPGAPGLARMSGRIDGRLVFGYAHDDTRDRGAIGAAEADAIVELMEGAGEHGAAIVGIVTSAGARLQEGVTSLGGCARMFAATVRLAGRVPQITIISGPTAGGASYSAALTDFVVMATGSCMFLTGPQVVREVTGEGLTALELGGARVHERSGLVDLVAGDLDGALQAARSLLSYLPPTAAQPSVVARVAGHTAVDPATFVPTEARRVYDVRDVARAVVDHDSLLELRPRWAQSMVTAFARIDGRPVGIVANQPRYRGGVIDGVSALKGADHVRACNRFGLPVVVLVDTPGFMPGSRHEASGIIDDGAELVEAFAAQRTPSATVVLRKAFGGAYIAMNSKHLGAGLSLAWTGSELGVMGGAQAAGILHRRQIAASDDPELARGALGRAYARDHLVAETAFERGLIDAVIAPEQTRSRLSSWLTGAPTQPGGR